MSLLTKSLPISLLPLFLSLIPLLQFKALALDTTTTSLSLVNTINVASNETDFHALLAFKSNILPGYQQALSSWDESLHFCHWEGVKCGRRHERVTVIDLASRGEIPTELGSLFRLQILDLNYNGFEGTIPTSLSRCSNLWYLGVGKNKLVGEFPKELTDSMPRLRALHVYKNNLTGGIPPSIGNLTSLVNITAHSNPWGGSIPNALGQLRNLKMLVLGDTNISEYGLGSEMSTSGDVYSYGILLLEMITRKRPTDIMFEGDLNLHNFTRIALPQRVMDPVLLTDERNGSKMEYLISIIEIGLACSTESPNDRMSIDIVLRELHLVKNNILKADMEI